MLLTGICFVSEPVSPKIQQPKKRRRKDLAKSHAGDDDGHNPSKPVKIGKKAGKPVPVVSETSHLSPVVALPYVSHEEKFPNQLNVSETKKAADTQNMLESSPSASLRGNSAQERDLDQQKIGVTQSKNPGDKLKDGSEISGNSSQRLHEKSSYAQERSTVGRSVKISDGIDQSVQHRDEKFNVSGFEDKNSSQTTVSCLLSSPLRYCVSLLSAKYFMNHFCMYFFFYNCDVRVNLHAPRTFHRQQVLGNSGYQG